MTKDPVCGMEVDETKSPHASAYQGQTYAFCGAGCKARFDKAPEKYLASPKTSHSCCERPSAASTQRHRTV